MSYELKVQDIQQIMRVADYVNGLSRTGGFGSIALLSEATYNENEDKTYVRSLQIEIRRTASTSGVKEFDNDPIWDQFKLGVITKDHTAQVYDVQGNYYTFLQEVAKIIHEWINNKSDDDLIIVYEGKREY